MGITIEYRIRLPTPVGGREGKIYFANRGSLPKKKTVIGANGWTPKCMPQTSIGNGMSFPFNLLYLVLKGGDAWRHCYDAAFGVRNPGKEDNLICLSTYLGALFPRSGWCPVLIECGLECMPQNSLKKGGSVSMKFILLVGNFGNFGNIGTVRKPHPAFTPHG